MATPSNGLALVFPADCRVAARAGRAGTPVVIDTRTHYPFDENIELRVETSALAMFPVFLPLPSWCKEPRLTINGEFQSFDAEPGGWLRIESEVLEVRPSRSRPGQGLIKVRTTTLNQNDEPVQVTVGNLVVPCRPT